MKKVARKGGNSNMGYLIKKTTNMGYENQKMKQIQSINKNPKFATYNSTRNWQKQKTKTDNFKRSLELADLLRGWDLGEIGDKRRSTSTCYRCLERGHSEWDCKKKKSNMDPVWEKKSNRGEGFRRQYSKRKSPMKPTQSCDPINPEEKGKDFLVNGTEGGNWDSTWYVNTKLTRHMTPNRELFRKIKNVFQNHEENEFSLTLYGVGEVDLLTEIRVFVIPYVAYTTQININVLSLSQLILQGFEVDFKDTKCTVTHMCASSKDDKEIEDNESANNEEKFATNGEKVHSIIETHEDFIDFMVCLNNDNICYKNKSMFEKGFHNVIVWFHEVMYGNKLTLPPCVNGIDVSLFDVYVINYGGFEKVSEGKEWDDIAMSFGYEQGFGQEFKIMFVKYLLQSEEYFKNALKEGIKIPSIVDQVASSGNASGGVAGSIGEVTASGNAIGGVAKGIDHGITQVEACIEKEDVDGKVPNIMENVEEDNGDSLGSEDDFVIII